jgi:hypothetical protein
MMYSWPLLVSILTMMDLIDGSHSTKTPAVRRVGLDVSPHFCPSSWRTRRGQGCSPLMARAGMIVSCQSPLRTCLYDRDIRVSGVSWRCVNCWEFTT